MQLGNYQLLAGRVATYGAQNVTMRGGWYTDTVPQVSPGYRASRGSKSDLLAHLRRQNRSVGIHGLVGRVPGAQNQPNLAKIGEKSRGGEGTVLADHPPLMKTAMGCPSNIPAGGLRLFRI